MRIGVLILLGVIVIAGVAYVITRRSSDKTVYETTTASGLKIHDEKIGDGPSPKMGQGVRVHDIGRFEDGREFNNSYQMGQPAAWIIANKETSSRES